MERALRYPLILRMANDIKSLRHRLRTANRLILLRLFKMRGYLRGGLQPTVACCPAGLRWWAEAHPTGLASALKLSRSEAACPVPAKTALQHVRSYHRNPIEIHGTAATASNPASSAPRYGQIRRIPASGDTRPMAQAA